MHKVTDFFDSKKRPSADHYFGLGQASSSSTFYAGGETSAPVSPVVSLFSHKRHSKVSSSVSSLTSLSGMGNPMEGSLSSKIPLGEVREEPVVERQCPEIEDDYFRMFPFNIPMAATERD
jgi:hypothetical protein